MRACTSARGGTAAVTLRGTIVRGDGAAPGGGVEVRALGGGRASLWLADAMLVDNRGRAAGALAIAASGAGSVATVTATHATIAGNAGARHGGAALFATKGGKASLKLRNSILRENRDSAGEAHDLFLSRAGTATATASALSSDVGVVAFDEEPGRAGVYREGPGCFDADPLFAAPAKGNYRLRAGSPCIDRGSPRFATPTDFEGNPRPTNTPDVGADERTPRR